MSEEFKSGENAMMAVNGGRILVRICGKPDKEGFYLVSEDYGDGFLVHKSKLSRADQSEPEATR